MILLDVKDTKTASSPLALTSKDKPLLSFSDLLRGAGEKKDLKSVQNGSLVLALNTDEKSSKALKTLLKVDNIEGKSDNRNSSTKEQTNSSVPKSQNLSLLLKDTTASLDKESEFLELNPQIAMNLTSLELKTLVNDAKNYLKDIIQNSDGYKKSEIKDLPKTLGGLIEAAKKFGIDISKISIEELQTSISNIKINKEEVANGSDSLSKEIAQEKKLRQTDEKQGLNTPQNLYSESKEVKSDDKTVQLQKDLKETPLFKAQATSEHTTTEQIVQTKANNLFKADQKAVQKEKLDDGLKLLLSDEKTSNQINSDPIAAKTTLSSIMSQESTKTLEHLLNKEAILGDPNQNITKSETFSTNKADSIEVKINEAKQMIRYLSNDIKNAIDEYKSPFTRVKVQLNPQNLGEIDLTIVQRGKNLHVNLSSNNAAINALSMNANELRVQLNNSGINNATLNFSDTSQQGGSYTDSGSGNSEQHKRQNGQKAQSEYSYFENEEAHEELLSSLEIIVPRYI